MYFHFLAAYAKALTVISAIGCGFWYFGASYSPYYSTALVLWATTFVEYWKVLERKISVRWGTYGAFRVEKLRHDYVRDGRSQLQRDFHRATRMAASVPVIFGFIAALAGILTTLFAIEAFVTRLYTGPLHQHVVSGTPTVLCFTLTSLSLRFPRGSSTLSSSRRSSPVSSGCTRNTPPNLQISKTTNINLLMNIPSQQNDLPSRRSYPISA